MKRIAQREKRARNFDAKQKASSKSCVQANSAFCVVAVRNKIGVAQMTALHGQTFLASREVELANLWKTSFETIFL